MAMQYHELREKVDKRIWYFSNHSFTFLVDAPYTLGHSQLVLKIGKKTKEEDNFAKASIHIANCIKIFSTKLKQCDQSNKWTQLANYTKTEGSYVKTLVLRVSADEEGDTYKVHLVPYFESHSMDTEALYQKTYNVSKGTGGLVYWLGKNEHKVEIDLLPNRDHPVVKKRIRSFRLEELTSFLCAV